MTPECNPGLDQFILDPGSQVFLHPREAREFKYSDGEREEAELLRTVEAVGDRSLWSGELRACINNWPSRYHFSPVRANLLRPLACFNSEAAVLELGAGCGAVTRYLGETCRRVDAVEGSRMRAAIARARCADLDRVKVFAGDFFQTEFEPRYQVATLIGVLEYAPLFCPEADSPRAACLRLLRKVAGVLDQGVLVMAIENKLGLKYWSGCGEDHTGRRYDGIHGYPGRTRTPVTFSRRELQELLTEAGFASCEWYYPFPDYKMPNTLFRETARRPRDLRLADWITTPFEDYLQERVFSFQEDLALRSLAEADLLWEFSNSFLVVASPRPRPAAAETWIAKRYSAGRQAAYATETTLEAGEPLRVEKKPLTPVSAPENADLEFVAAIRSPWQDGDLLSSRMSQAIQSPDGRSALTACLRSYLDYLTRRHAAPGTDADGMPLIAGAALDCTPWNLVMVKKDWVFIDDEWRSRAAIPADFLLFRSLFHFVENHKVYLLRNGLLKGETAEFIIGLIREFFPTYNEARDQTHRERERRFLELAQGRPVQLVSRWTADETVRLRNEVQSLQASLKAQEQVNERLQVHLQHLQTSNWWRAVRRYYAFKDWCFPPGGFVRRVLKRLLRRRP